MYQDTRVRNNLIVLLTIIATAVILGTIVISGLLSELVTSSEVFSRKKAVEEVLAPGRDNVKKELPATIALSPQTKTLSVGDTFDVNIKLNTGQARVSVVQVTLSYPYQEYPDFEVQDMDGDETNGVQIKPGRLKGLRFLTNDVVVNKDLKRVSITLSAIVSNPAGAFKTKTDVVFGTITFKAVSATYSKTLSFNQESSRVVSEVSGEDILNTPINGSYTIR